MERFFILDKYNTYYNWRLILTAKDVTPPDPKTNYVEIDGMSGSLDLSESLTGEVTYKDRKITASFWTDEGTRKEREILMSNIVARLHGRKIRLIEPDDPDHYFYGRVTIGAPKNTTPFLTFEMSATCDPWRYALHETERRVEIDSSTITNVVINNNGVKTICPLIRITGEVEIIHSDVKTVLTDGEYKLSDIKLYQGANVIGVSGNGSATFVYREATL